jgi:hypothetical protein
MTGTLNTLMITVPAAIVVAAVYAKIPGGAQAVFDAAARLTRGTCPCCGRTPRPASASPLAFGLLAATVSDQTFWQKVWAVKSRDVGRTFLWSGALFYPIPICLGMLGLVGIAYGLKPADIGGDIVAIGPTSCPISVSD